MVFSCCLWSSALLMFLRVIIALLMFLRVITVIYHTVITAIQHTLFLWYIALVGYNYYDIILLAIIGYPMKHVDFLISKNQALQILYHMFVTISVQTTHLSSNTGNQVSTAHIYRFFVTFWYPILNSGATFYINTIKLLEHTS